MVLGNISKYVEGFESFTADDEMMLANLKQALNYTKSNMAISDVTTKLPSTSGLGLITNTTTPNTTMPEIPIAPATRPLPSFTNQTPSNSIIRNSEPINNKISMSSSKLNNTKPTQYTSMKNNSMKNNTMKNNSMKNNISKFKNIENQNLENSAKKDYESDEENDAESDEENEDEDQDLDTPDSKLSLEPRELEGMKSSHKDNEDDEDDEDDEDHADEGFQGSQQIEGKTLQKMLLALLITFLGYMLILSAMNNLIPIAKYAPHLKQFKHFIYGGLFFLIVYLCLEVF